MRSPISDISALGLVLVTSLFWGSSTWSASPDDDLEIKAIAEDRSQRLELLRTTTPAPIVDTQLTPQSHRSDSVLFNTPAEPVLDDKSRTIPVTISRNVSARASVMPSKSKVAIKPSKTIGVDHRYHAHGRHHKVLNQSVLIMRSRNISGARKVHAWESAKERRCGFCLVDGFVYCGDQGVSLKNLIEQDYRNNARAKMTGIKRNQHQKELTSRRASGRKFVHKPHPSHGNSAVRAIYASTPRSVPSRKQKSSPYRKGD